MVGAAMVVVLLWVTGAGAYLGAVVVARHRAQAAADLAALAAAGRLPSGAAGACDLATAVARKMGADDARCAVDGLDVVVTVRVAVGFGSVARAAARAGPSCTGGQVVSAGAFGSPAATSSSSVGKRNETNAAKVSGSSSTLLTVACTGTQSTSWPRIRSTRLVGPSANSSVMEAIRCSSSGWTFGRSEAAPRQS
ncbi:MAG: flp pilus-assembly TadE/G-like family protein [Mycobacterium sp.]|nr:flp pilus-assembly TadE/G-like family protein [Mycobacterium sp.]